MLTCSRTYEQVIALLDEYHLSKDDFDAIMELELLTNGS